MFTIPFTSIRQVRELYPDAFGLPARSPQHSQLHCWSLLPPDKGSKQEQWGWHLTSLLGTTPVPQASAIGTISTCPAPYGFPKLHSTQSLHTGCFNIRPPSVQKRLYKDWGARRTLQGPKEFSRVGVFVSTIVYIPFHCQRVDGGSIQLLWLTCKVAGSMFPDTWPESISVQNKRSKQDQQRITTYTLPSYLEPPQAQF